MEDMAFVKHSVDGHYFSSVVAPERRFPMSKADMDHRTMALGLGNGKRRSSWRTIPLAWNFSWV